MKLRLIGLAGGLAALSSLLVPADARACGACFHQEADSTVVTGHRMAFAISPAQSVLWDQIQYAGDPAAFAWVLPIKPGAYVQVASDAWFETLDAATTVNVVGPNPDCGTSGGVGCGAQAESAAAADAFGGDGVTVVHSGTVGPYDTVTLSTTTPGALNTWLTGNGFAVGQDMQPVIDAYVADGFDFIALKLQPGAGVNRMKPVRVVSPGGGATLPLRMVAGGTGAQVPIILYVISEGRWAAKTFANTTVPVALLSWDYLAAESNYATLRERVLATGDGSSWLTVYAHQGALLSPVANPLYGSDIQYNTGDFNFVDTVSEAYFAQASSNGESSALCSGDFSADAKSSRVVVNPCAPGEALDSPSCGVAEGGIDARQFLCGSDDKLADDLAISLLGLHPADVWVTRLEANLPRAALAKDLELTPADHQIPVENWVQAKLKIHEDDFCGSAFMPPTALPRGGSEDDGRRTGALVGWALAAFALCGAVARRATQRLAAARRRS